jgi:hypothetical protein
MPGPPIAAAGSTDRITSRGARAPSPSFAVTVGVSCTPATPFSAWLSPAGNASCAASSIEITDWLAPVSATKGNGPAPLIITGPVIRR